MKCDGCKFWNGSAITQLGECRRYPPSIIAKDPRTGGYQDFDRLKAKSPLTYADFWCGEYADKNPDWGDHC